MTVKKRNIAIVFAALAVSIALTVSACLLCVGDTADKASIRKYAAANAQNEKFALYTVSNIASKVEYGTYNAAEHTPSPAPAHAATGSVTGIKVSLAQGDWLRYNKVIDLSDCTEQTDKANQLLSLCVTPDSIGSLDAETIDIFFTDAYDPDNYFQVNVFNSQDEGGLTHTNAYIKGRANGQQLTGWEWNAGKKHVDNIYGYPVRLAFSGLLAHYTDVLHNIADNSINISVNYAEREIHSAVHQASGSSTVVCDLDSGGDFSNLWKGFTTGECFMSIRAGNFAKEKSNFVITRIDGNAVTDDMYFTDRGLPRVTVDTGVYSSDALPEAVIGNKYPLFGATCTSPYDGKLDVTARVKFGSEEIAVSDNAFVPVKAGEYTLVYEAKDKYGVVGSATLTVNAPQSVQSMAIADCGYPAECFAGELINVPTPQLTGGSGIPQVKKTVDFGGNVTEITGNTFRPTKAGKYTFAITATDYCGQKEFKTHVLNVAPGDKPVFTEDAKLPRYFVSGAQYALPALDAYDFTDGSGNAVKSTVTITDRDGEKNVRGKITPVARSSGDIVTVTYTATLAGKSSAKVSYDIPTVIVKEGRDVNLEKLLYSPDSSVTSVTATENGAQVTASKKATVDFINPLPAHGFDFEFRIPQSGANFGELTVLLTDSEDPSVQCKFVYRKSGNTTEFISDGVATVNRASQKFGSEDLFGFNYNAIRNEVSFDPESKTTAPVVQTVSGEKFEGFASGKVYLTLVIGDTTKSSCISVVSVGGQYLTDDAMDFVAPKIAVLGNAGGSHEYGSRITLPAAIACDCVDYTVSLKLTVLDPDRIPVAATDGTLLQDVTDCGREYEIVLDKAGAYSVLYTAEDLSENRTDIGSYRIQVVDINKPTITVNGAVPSSGTVGSQIVVPSAIATDDMSENLAVKIYVITARGNIFELEDRAFTPKSAGKYVIRYWCIDDAGNIQTADYAVAVS